MTKRQRLGLAVLAGAAAALGHAPFGLWALALVGFAALIGLVSAAERPGIVAWGGGVGYFGVALHWIVEPFLVDIATHGWMAPFALILLAIGLAVALDWGLIVPVIRNADELSISGLSRRVADLAQRARAKKLNPDEVQGGTFTITNPGQFGRP